MKDTNPMEIKFYAADLAAYNSGFLHGAWIDADSDVDAMQESIAKLLATSPCPNVTATCPWCEGDGTETRRNSETGETQMVDCQHCGGKGELPSAEEWVVHGYDDEAGLICDMGESSDLKAIAERFEAFEEIESDYDDAILPFLLEWVAEKTDPDNWKSQLDDAFAGVWDDPEDYAADLAEYLSEGVDLQTAWAVAKENQEYFG